jgi:hypothetical protein
MIRPYKLSTHFAKIVGVTTIFLNMVSLKANGVSQLSLDIVKEPQAGSLAPSFLSTLNRFFHPDIFIETGTLFGGTAQRAAHIFKEVHSIELSPDLYKNCYERLKGISNIKLHLGDSSKVLPTLLPTLRNKKLLFWLDGHYSGGPTAKGSTNTALEFELEAIRRSGAKNNIIVIDDIRICDTFSKGSGDPTLDGYPTLGRLSSLLYAINPHYRLVVLGDVLLAYPNIDNLVPSAVVKACTISRLYDGSNVDYNHILSAERVIAQAQGKEKRALQELYNGFGLSELATVHGVGKHYILWQALLLMHEHKYAQAHHLLTLVYNQNQSLTHWRIKWYMAQSAYKLGRKNEATMTLKEVIKQNPHFANAQHLLKSISK